MAKAYCAECGRMMNYEVSDYEEEEVVGGVTITYTAKSAECKFCGTPVSVDSINDENRVARSEAIKKAKACNAG